MSSSSFTINHHPLLDEVLSICFDLSLFCATLIHLTPHIFRISSFHHSFIILQSLRYQSNTTFVHSYSYVTNPLQFQSLQSFHYIFTILAILLTYAFQFLHISYRYVKNMAFHVLFFFLISWIYVECTYYIHRY